MEADYLGQVDIERKQLRLLSARGIASGQWWRKGRSHIDEAELWLLRSFEGGAGTYEKVTSRGAKELWPMWSGDGRNLFYVSDRSDAGNKNGALPIVAACLLLLVERGLAQLVLTIVELIRQVMERQAIRRMESGSLSDDQVERMGATFMQLDRRMAEVAADQLAASTLEATPAF